jgi:hypothetical protein
MRNPRHVTVRVDGKRWRRVLSFSDSGSADHHFLLETKPNGSTTVRFGDGVHGASPRKALKVDAILGQALVLSESACVALQRGALKRGIRHCGR